MTAERGSDDQTPIDLAKEIKAVCAEVEVKKQRVREKGEEETRRRAEEKALREAENSKHNEKLSQRVQETGIRAIFLETKEALAQHYSDAVVDEVWRYSDGLYSHRYYEYSIRLKWNHLRERFRESLCSATADYNLREDTLRINYHKLGENERQDAEALKRKLFECIRKSIERPTVLRESRYTTGTGIGEEAKFHGGG